MFNRPTARSVVRRTPGESDAALETRRAVALPDRQASISRYVDRQILWHWLNGHAMEWANIHPALQREWDRGGQRWVRNRDNHW